MKKKLTLDQIAAAGVFLQQLSVREYGFSLTRAIARLQTTLEPDLILIDKQKLELLKKHGATNKGNGAWEFAKEDDVGKTGFQTDFGKFLENEIEITFEGLNEDLFEGATMSPAAYNSLSLFFAPPAPEKPLPKNKRGKK